MEDAQDAEQSIRDYERQVLSEIEDEEPFRFKLKNFISRSKGRNRRRSSATEVRLICDTYSGSHVTLHEDWFDRADEVDYFLTGDALITRLIMRGKA